MARPSNRDKILTEGLKVVHRRGFGGASVRDIVHAAGVPQGSFTNHFASKEAFGIEILDLYFAATRALLDATLCNASLAPLERLRAWVGACRLRLAGDGAQHGCMFGNFGGEAIDHSDAIRARIAAAFDAIAAAVENCLDAARDAGELPAGVPASELAECIVGGMQGAILMCKVQRSAAPLEHFERVLFSLTLGRPAA